MKSKRILFAGIAAVLLTAGVLGAFAFALSDRQAKNADGADVDYAKYAGVDVETASLETVEEIAFLDFYAAPESLRDTIIQARNVLLFTNEFWKKHNVSQVALEADTFWKQEIWLIGERGTGVFAFEKVLETAELGETLIFAPTYADLFPDAVFMFGESAIMLDYARYAGVDLETASLETVEKIAFLNLGEAPESLRASILYARDVFIRRVEWFAERDFVKILGYADELYTSEMLEAAASEENQVSVRFEDTGFFVVWINPYTMWPEVACLSKTSAIYPPWERYESPAVMPD
ncbi:MAG: hypothetical protein FWH06_03120 [Oscillospiraceae bacterium]|nr:hypothetical protein [Oscillospiraceae bacterium]